MTRHIPPPLETTDVISRIRAELATPAPLESPYARRMAGIRALQRTFRKEPIGGRLTRLKRAVYWFTASAFDRQGKVVEALIDFVDELASENERLSRELMQVSGAAGHTKTASPKSKNDL